MDTCIKTKVLTSCCCAGSEEGVMEDVKRSWLEELTYLLIINLEREKNVKKVCFDQNNKLTIFKKVESD